MSPLAYTVLHVGAVMLMYMALGGLAVLAGTASSDDGKPTRRYLTILHGTALLIIFVAGFGLMAKKLALGGPGTWPGYIWLKMVLWLLLGGSTVLLRKQPSLMRPMMVILPIVGLFAGYVALFKPF